MYRRFVVVTSARCRLSVGWGRVSSRSLFSTISVVKSLFFFLHGIWKSGKANRTPGIRPLPIDDQSSSWFLTTFGSTPLTTIHSGHQSHLAPESTLEYLFFPLFSCHDEGLITVQNNLIFVVTKQKLKVGTSNMKIGRGTKTYYTRCPNKF